VIGSARDLEAAKLADVTHFFATWYVPGNAILAVVGDVEPEAAFAAVEKYLGWIDSPRLPPRNAFARKPLAKEERLQLTDRVELPRLLIGWQSPKNGTQADAECELLAAILGRGKASRLYDRLVHKDGSAATVEVTQDSREAQSVFGINVLAAPGHTLGEILSAVDDELKTFLATGPGQAELDAARTGVYTGFARDLEGLVPRAIRLTSYQLDFGAADSLKRDLNRYETATPESVRDAAARVLGAPRVVVEVAPAVQR